MDLRPRTKYDPPDLGIAGTLIVYGLFGGMFCLMLGIAALRPPDTEPKQVTPAHHIVTRGDRIIALQFPALSTRVDLTTIYDYGRASRQFLPTETGDRITSQELTPEQRQAFEDLRVEWCRNPPRSMQPYYYDIGFRCSGFRGRRVMLPKDALPPIFATLLETLPAPQ